MKKSLSIIPAIVLALSLTGCGTSPETPPETSGANSSDTSSENSEPVSGDSSSESSSSESSGSDTPAPVGNEITAQFETPNGEPVDLTNAVVHGHEGEIPLSEMTENNWLDVMCSDYVYLAEPQGIYYDSVKNADIFDENEMTFTGAPETVSYKFKKYKVGDSFGELKVSKARTSFCSQWFDSKPKYFNGGFVRFEGEITLTGKCYLSPEDDVYVLKRDIKFFPDADNSRKLPVMEYSSDENGNRRLHTSMNGTVCWISEYPTGIALGNAGDHPDLDFSEFPEDGSLVDVQVTIDNISFRNELNFTKSFSARLVDIKLV